MKVFYSITIAFIIIVASCQAQSKDRLFTGESVRNPISQQHISFTRNDGQVDTKGRADCRFSTHYLGANFFFCADGIISDFQKSGVRTPESRIDINTENLLHSQQLTDSKRRIGHVLKLNFVGRTNFFAEITGEEEQEYKCNYFIGNDKKKWHTDVSNYSRILYRDVWEGIDVEYYGATMGFKNPISLEYDVIVHPGSSPNVVRFAYQGDEGVSVNNNGDLIVKTSIGDVIEQKPYVYQIVNGGKKEISSGFELAINGEISFIIGMYDNAKDLIIDPQLIYSTYLGGSKEDEVYGISVDKQGFAYVTGQTLSMTFPRTVGAYDTTYSGMTDVFISKLTTTDNSLVYSTFLGGDSIDIGWAISLGQSIEGGTSVYVTGVTTSLNFPVTSGCFQSVNNGGADVFVTQLSSGGNSLVYSTFIGGGGVDEAHGITVDDSDNAYLVGGTWSSNFPTTSNAFQKTNKGGTDVFVAKLNPLGSNLLFSTYIGGWKGDRGVAISLQPLEGSHQSQNIFITGLTGSSDFPTTAGVPQPTYPGDAAGNSTAFVAKINAVDGSLIYNTFLGGSVGDYGFAIASDVHGNAYVTGRTFSLNFPITSNAYKLKIGSGGSGTNAFLTEIDSAGQNFLYSTFFGGDGKNSGEAGLGIGVDKSGYVYIAGQTFSFNPPFPTTQDAYQQTSQGSEDAFLAKFDPTAFGKFSLLYSTIFGGQYSDAATSLAMGDSGKVYFAGQTSSPNFPTTTNAYWKNFYHDSSWSRDGFVSVFQFPYQSSNVVQEEGNINESILTQNFPNPFTGSTEICFSPNVHIAGGVFEVRDMLGRSVYQMPLENNLSEIHFDASSLPAGMYVYSLMTRAQRLSKMMTHLP